MTPKRVNRKQRTSKFTMRVLVPIRLLEPDLFDPENSIGFIEKSADEDQITSETPAQIVGSKSISAGFDDEFEDDNVKISSSYEIGKPSSARLFKH